ncbi:MAG: HipA protein, partial [Eubacteriales bacterium]
MISEEALSSTSPEFGTDGYYAKCWVREDDDIYLYKSDSDTYEIEPLSECLACQLAEQVYPAAVRYDLDFYYHKLISKCRLFTDEAHGLAKLSDFPDYPNIVSGLMKFYEKFGAEDVLRRMFVLDALILNTDRHLGNFGFLFDNQTIEVKTAAPMFDHNRSLLFDLDE